MYRTTTVVICFCLFLSVLAVDLLAFKANVLENNKVHLSWETQSELNNDYFILQRSADNESRDDLEKIAGGGTVERISEYEVIDTKPLINTSYYRLQQVDFNGAISYSEIASVNISIERTDIVLSPNPAVEKLTVESPTPGTVKIFNAAGQQMGNYTKHNGKLDISIGEFSEGIYFLRLFDNDNQKIADKKFIKIE